jgi:hemolysin activation/secretion protein
LNLDNQYRLDLPLGCQLITRCDLQLSDHPLLAIEQGGLGGYDTVRGYREMLLVRDNIASASAELRYPIFPGRKLQVSLAPFTDIGYSWDHHPAPDNPLLSSVGIGLVATVYKSIQAEIYYAHPLKDVPVYHRNLQDDGVTFSIIFRPG